jgi:hypothetical protein
MLEQPAKPCRCPWITVAQPLEELDSHRRGDLIRPSQLAQSIPGRAIANRQQRVGYLIGDASLSAGLDDDVCQPP